jgi:hypothetical protein
MSEQNFGNTPSMSTPPHKIVPITQRLVGGYKLWRSIHEHVPKRSKFTMGSKIDSLFLEVIEMTYVASYLSGEQKIPHLQIAIKRLDVLKFFLYVAWDAKDIDNKKYISISEELNEIGRMLGGWINSVVSKKKTPGQ